MEPTVFPYRDENPTESFPLITVSLIVVNLLAWWKVQGLGFDDTAMATSLCNFGVIPGELTQLAAGKRFMMSPQLMCVVDAAPEPLTLLTTQFLHGGWMHLLGNMLFLWVFGNNVEDELGKLRFLFFYLSCGVLATLGHVLTEPASAIPLVGASGAISGVLGAYLVLFPRARVWTALPLLIFILRIPLPAWVFLLYWIGLQLLSGFLDAAHGDGGGGVAFWAHVVGFVAGMVLLRFVRPHGWRKRSVREKAFARRK